MNIQFTGAVAQVLIISDSNNTKDESSAESSNS